MPVRGAIAALFWRCSRWRFLPERPPVSGPRVFVAGPHTSNWDFALMLAIAWSERLRVRWLGKRELFRGPTGPLMRALGGIPVDRSRPGGIVDAVVDLADRDPEFALVVTPEGTRRGSGWRSGFYRIARGADLPVTLAFVDSASRTTGIGPTFRLTGEIGADMDRIRAFYADKHGIRPERGTEPRLRDEGGPPPPA